MRITNLRLAILICALGALSESLFYTALAPMLTHLDSQLGFQEEQAGLLVAGYAIGYWFGVSAPSPSPRWASLLPTPSRS